MEPIILYEDNHLIVAEKPPNMLSQADETGDPDMLSILKGYIKEKYHKPGAVYLGLVHRLDRPVGGVMVFARTSKAAERLTKQFASRAAKKTYAAIVEGTPAFEARLSDKLDFRDGRAVRDEETGKPCALRYHVRAREGNLSLLEVGLETGRKHQIRAQLALRGWPIRFDQRYHPSPEKGQIRLWAVRLSFEHPTTHERLTFSSCPPWPEFETAIRAFDAPCNITYLDEKLICADKDAGVEVARADGAEQSLQAALEKCFGTLWPVHRLDANTRGVVLFARTEETARELEKAQHNFIKKYLCICVGTPPEDFGDERAYLKKNADTATVTVSRTRVPGAKDIRTIYRVKQKKNGLSLLEITLPTGRTHQIRAHMAFLGCPVLGDDKYGDRERNRKEHIRTQTLISKQLELHFDNNSPLSEYDGKRFTSLRELNIGEEQS